MTIYYYAVADIIFYLDAVNFMVQHGVHLEI